MLAISTITTSKTNKTRTKHIEWDEFVRLLASPVETQETPQEYKKMSKDDQGVVKDQGGFIGGPVKDNKRKKGNVAFRTMLTLDADTAKMDLLERFEEMGVTGAIYSTHSHSPEQPKFRVVIPLKTGVATEDFIALTNWFAINLGLEYFDPTCDQPERLMYWPSHSKGGEYILREYTKGLFDPSAFFEANPEWRDPSMWALSTKGHKDQVANLDDPREKPGAIGAFCSAYYPIQSAIDEFLTDVYVSTIDENRYTYLKGSTSNGVVIYNDLWAFSNHSTDPAAEGNHNRNAFDLVRVHKFGDGGDSTKQMLEFASSLDGVNALMAMAEFAEDIPEEDNEWVAHLEMTARGQVVQSMGNVTLVLMNDPWLKDKIYYNELSDRIIGDPSLPWREGRSMSWSEHDLSSLKLYLEGKWGLNKSNVILDAFNAMFMHARVNPAQDYLRALEWDGVCRLETMLIDYLGAADTEYIRSVTKTWMIGAVARMMTPGCQFDHMLILVGPQGLGKSAFLRSLCGAEWFSESQDKLDGSKEAAEKVRGKWIVCVDEMSAMGYKGVEQEQIKSFITRLYDTYRPAYGRYVVDVPRTCAFAGTSNADVFLKDSTGNRRYWPVVVNRKPVEVWAGKVERDQLWAEAFLYWDCGMPIHLDDDMTEEAMKVQEDFTERDDMLGSLEDFLGAGVPVDFYDRTVEERKMWFVGDIPEDVDLVPREYICRKEVWVEFMHQDPSSFPRKNQFEVKRLMEQSKMLKRDGKKRINGYGPQHVYRIYF